LVEFPAAPSASAPSEGSFASASSVGGSGSSYLLFTFLYLECFGLILLMKSYNFLFISLIFFLIDETYAKLKMKNNPKHSRYKKVKRR
jgi:hypothetical protein